MSTMNSVQLSYRANYMEKHAWLKNRGYLHITNNLNIFRDRDKLISIVQNPNYVARHAFLPLIHAVINERRFKIIDDEGTRAHSFKDKDGNPQQTVKHRPLHYAGHLDALIFGYYAQLIQEKYETFLHGRQEISSCITAYRKIPIPESDKNKSTIHFAHDVFEEIKNRADEGCTVLKFDIKSFFSRLNHQQLKKAWAKLLGEDKLPADHFNVFNAVTNFSYILKDQLRLPYIIGKKRSGFDEKHLAQIRKKGIVAFYEDVASFRLAVKEKRITIFKHPFRNADGEPVGIPQGLPISAVLANLYLLEFDEKVVQNIVKPLNAYYRRYSDDIIIICKNSQAEAVKEFTFSVIEESKVEMSKEKTEIFAFNLELTSRGLALQCRKLADNKILKGFPFTYLGFEFYGEKTLIKSANLAKFYRRMIKSVKGKAKRALTIARQHPGKPLIIYRRQLHRIYTLLPLDSTKIYRKRKRLVQNARGEYYYISTRMESKHKTTYLSYVSRASEIMGEPAIGKQIRNHKKIFNQAYNRHLNRAKQRQ